MYHGKCFGVALEAALFDTGAETCSREARIIKVFEGLPIYLRVWFEGQTIKFAKFLRVLREGRV